MYWKVLYRQKTYSRNNKNSNSTILKLLLFVTVNYGPVAPYVMYVCSELHRAAFRVVSLRAGLLRWSGLNSIQSYCTVP